jgi:hypothetical protein
VAAFGVAGVEAEATVGLVVVTGQQILAFARQTARRRSHGVRIAPGSSLRRICLDAAGIAVRAWLGGRSMQNARGKTWIPVGIAVVMGLGGCSGSAAPGGAAPSSLSPPPADPAVAFTQYDTAAKPFECGSAFSAMIDAVEKPDYGAVKDSAKAYREVLATWDAQLGTIAFPVAVKPIIDGLRQHTAAELAALDELAKIDIKDTERMTLVERHVEAVDAAVEVDGDAVRAALGHPVPQAGVAADQLMLADQTFYQTDADVSAKWKAAIAAHDLNGAKAANALEEDAAQAYIDRLGTIDWPPSVRTPTPWTPPSGFDRQVTALRDNLHGIIDFDRHQVDVATTAQIVEGTPELSKALSDNEVALWTALVQAYRKAVPTSCATPPPPR